LKSEGGPCHPSGRGHGLRRLRQGEKGNWEEPGTQKPLARTGRNTQPPVKVENSESEKREKVEKGGKKKLPVGGLGGFKEKKGEKPPGNEKDNGRAPPKTPRGSRTEKKPVGKSKLTSQGGKGGGTKNHWFLPGL